MAKRRYRRLRKRSRWAPNIVEINNSYTAQSGSFSNQIDLAMSPEQTSNIVTQIYTVKNFDITFTIESSTHWSLEAVTAYIIFVPQGMNVTDNYPMLHPEYIMNYKYLGSPTGIGTSTSAEVQQFQPFKVRTRLSRKLNTGDKIMLFIRGFNEASSSLTYTLSGIVRWWTKAN